nr:hypothetical protein [Pseudoruegeria aquimaris]
MADALRHRLVLIDVLEQKPPREPLGLDAHQVALHAGIGGEATEHRSPRPQENRAGLRLAGGDHRLIADHLHIAQNVTGPGMVGDDLVPLPAEKADLHDPVGDHVDMRRPPFLRQQHPRLVAQDLFAAIHEILGNRRRKAFQKRRGAQKGVFLTDAHGGRVSTSGCHPRFTAGRFKRGLPGTHATADVRKKERVEGGMHPQPYQSLVTRRRHDLIRCRHRGISHSL